MKTLIYTVLDLVLMHCTYKQIKNNMKSKFVQPITDGLSVDFIGTVGLGMIPYGVNGIGSWYVSILINILKNLHKNDYIFMETDYPLLQFFFVNESRQLKTIKLAHEMQFHFNFNKFTYKLCKTRKSCTMHMHGGKN